MQLDEPLQSPLNGEVSIPIETADIAGAQRTIQGVAQAEIFSVLRIAHHDIGAAIDQLARESGGGDALPSRGGDALPSRGGDALPSRGGDALPRWQKRKKPYNLLCLGGMV